VEDGDDGEGQRWFNKARCSVLTQGSSRVTRGNQFKTVMRRQYRLNKRAR
jgi:hypothetical protein